jgi:hypothetical protein
VFSADITDLPAANISVRSYATGDPVSKGTVTGSGTNWSLAVDVTTREMVTVRIGRNNIETASKYITLYSGQYNLGETGPGGGTIFYI